MAEQAQLFDAGYERSLLDRLLSESRLYKTSKDYKELLDFVVRLRQMAPFNAMLLQIQKPGLKYAMTAKDWRSKFGRLPKEGARPLVIMWPFGPVGFVYDVLDTEGSELPQDVFTFTARGEMDANSFERFKVLLERKNMSLDEIDQRDAHAGLTRLVSRSDNGNKYEIYVNKNHSLATQFTTLAHELGHIFLGHLGDDEKLKIKDRTHKSDDQKEIEAESVAYIVCNRTGIEPRSQNYLSDFIENDEDALNLDIYAILAAAGSVENLLALNPKAFRPRME